MKCVLDFLFCTRKWEILFTHRMDLREYTAAFVQTQGSKCRRHQASAVARMHRMILCFSHDLCNCVYHYNHFYVKIYINFAISLGVAVALPSVVHYTFFLWQSVACGASLLLSCLFIYRSSRHLFVDSFFRFSSCLFSKSLLYSFSSVVACVWCVQNRRINLRSTSTTIHSCAACIRVSVFVTQHTLRRLSSCDTVSFYRKKKNAIFVSIWTIRISVDYMSFIAVREIDSIAHGRTRRRISDAWVWEKMKKKLFDCEDIRSVGCSRLCFSLYWRFW